jgi:hypothetical protein
VQLPPLQVWPAEQACPQLPQFAVLVVVSMQLPGVVPQSIWPAPEQAQEPPLQAAPAGQAVPQPPQLRASFVRFAQLPAAHCVCPVGQLLEQPPLLQICPVEQMFVQLPQWLLSDETQALLQMSSPPWH